MNLIQFLFGKKLIVSDDFFGKIESERTRTSYPRSLSWHFKTEIPSFREKTYMIIEGNYLGLDIIQKKTLKNFIVNFTDIYSIKIDQLIKENQNFHPFQNWRDDYYISWIYPINNSNSEFDIMFEPYVENDDSDSFIIELINEDIFLTF